MSARPTGLRVHYLPPTPLPNRPRRPLDVRLRQGAVDRAPELTVLALALVALLAIGFGTQWEAVRILASFVAGVR